jgi:hypothetical protein
MCDGVSVGEMFAVARTLCRDHTGAAGNRDKNLIPDQIIKFDVAIQVVEKQHHDNAPDW